MSILPSDWGLYAAAVSEAHEVTGLPLALIWAVMVQESACDPMARRVEHGFYERYIRGKPEFVAHTWGKTPSVIAASFGLMQVMYTTAEEALRKRLAGALCAAWDHTPWGLCVPRTNVLIGAAILSDKRAQYGPEGGIAAYNAGSARKSGNGGEWVNQNYVSSVLKLWKQIETETKTGDA